MQRKKPDSDAKKDARDVQNAVFLRELRRTANISMASEAAGCSKSTMQSRRRLNPDFAAQWDAATAFACARLASRGSRPAGSAHASGTAKSVWTGDTTIAEGGEFTVRQRQFGVTQVRRAAKGELTAAGERAFLAHVAATANISLSAEAVGISLQPIYHRKKTSAAFARALQAAIEEGHEALEIALLDSAFRSLNPGSAGIGDHIDGLSDEAAAMAPPPAWERMTPDQALHLLTLHRRSVALREPRRAHNARKVTPEETDKVLWRLIKRAEAKLRRDEAKARERGE